MKNNTIKIIIAVALAIIIFLVGFNVALYWARQQIKHIRSHDETTSEATAKAKEKTVIPIKKADYTFAEVKAEQVQETPKIINLGEYKLTAYCPCEKCCGKSDGITATETTATAGRTIAVDPSIIPYGSTVIINGNEYIAEDCGGAIKENHIDIFFDTHDEALNFGVQYANVFLKGN